jgi:hypothetical protein
MLVLAAATCLVLGGLTEDFRERRSRCTIAWWVRSLLALVASTCSSSASRSRSGTARPGAAVGRGRRSPSRSISSPRAAGRQQPLRASVQPVRRRRLDLLYGVLYGINMFIGFESAANLAEETERPEAARPARRALVAHASSALTSS